MAEPQKKGETEEKGLFYLFGKKTEPVRKKINESPSHPFRKLVDVLSGTKPKEKDR